jgi:hypothetical protein
MREDFDVLLRGKSTMMVSICTLMENSSRDLPSAGLTACVCLSGAVPRPLVGKWVQDEMIVARANGCGELSHLLARLTLQCVEKESKDGVCERGSRGGRGGLLISWTPSWHAKDRR